jgi:hypothetical protein
VLTRDCAASAVAPSNMSRCYPMAHASGNAFDWLAFVCSLHVVLQHKLSSQQQQQQQQQHSIFKNSLGHNKLNKSHYTGNSSYWYNKP